MTYIVGVTEEDFVDGVDRVDTVDRVDNPINKESVKDGISLMLERVLKNGSESVDIPGDLASIFGMNQDQANALRIKQAIEALKGCTFDSSIGLTRSEYQAVMDVLNEALTELSESGVSLDVQLGNNED